MLEEQKGEAPLARLPEAEKRNLQLVKELFEREMEKRQRAGALILVGGSLTKPFPRKDLDVLIIFEKDGRELDNPGSTPYRRALGSFKLVQEIVEAMVEGQPTLRVHKVIAPAIDEEFDSESILKHDGSITVKPNAGAEIEFIKCDTRAGIREPFVIIAEAK